MQVGVSEERIMCCLLSAKGFKNTRCGYMHGKSERERERVVDERPSEVPSYNHFNM